MPKDTPVLRRDLLVSLGVFVLWFSVLTVIRFSIVPSAGLITYVDPLGDAQTKALPFTATSFAPSYEITMPIGVPVLSPRWYEIKVDDCIEVLDVNDTRVIPDQIPTFCSPHRYRDIALGKYLEPGENVLTIGVRDYGGGMGIDLRQSERDPLNLFLVFLSLGLIVWFALRLLTLSGMQKEKWKVLLLMLLCGAFLRAFYVSATPYLERSHDGDAHIDYIDYVSDHWSIPLASTGWEFHQAPLYYFFSAGWMAFTESLGFARNASLTSLEYWSLLFSILALAFAVLAVVGFLRDPPPEERFLIVTVIGSFTGLIFFSSRLSNEALFSVLGFLGILLLLRWWRTGSDRLWYALCIVLSVGFITKVSALLLLVVAFLCLLLRPGRPLRHKIRQGVLSGLLVVLLAGWLPIYRFMETDSTNVTTLGNQSMHGGLEVPRSFKLFTTLNPIETVRRPFNDTWTDDWRREYFPEFFLKSALFGEFRFESQIATARTMVFLAILLLFPLLYGIFTDLFHFPLRNVPMHVLTFFLLLAAVLYASLFPYAPNQDFRQSILLVVPATYYVAVGIERMKPSLRHFFLVIGYTFALLSAYFVVQLFFAS